MAIMEDLKNTKCVFTLNLSMIINSTEFDSSNHHFYENWLNFSQIFKVMQNL